MVPWSHLRQPLLRVTVDEAEIGIDTLNYIIIRLSKAKQLAFRLCSILRSPAGPVVPGNLVKGFSACVKPCWTIRNFVFCCSSSFHTATMTWTMTGRQAHVLFLQVWFLLMVFGEVEHIVHLIRWNLNSCLCHCGTTWLRSRRGITHDS